jgi:hypothetical protein
MVVGVGAYLAFKMREQRKPRKKGGDETMDDAGLQEPVFLKLYVPSTAREPVADKQ